MSKNRFAEISTAKNPAPEELLLQGNDYYSYGNYDLAIESYKHAIETKPSLFEAYLSLGKIYVEQEKYTLAADILTLADHVKENSPEVNYFLGVVYDIQGNYEKALKAYNIAKSSSEFGFYAEDAINAINKKISIQLEDANSYLKVGLAYYEKQQYEKALEYFLSAERLNPNDYHINYHLGRVYHRLTEYTKAVSSFEKALSLNAKCHECLYKLSSAYYELAQYDVAFEKIKKAAKLNPDYKNAELYKSLQYACHKGENKSGKKVNPEHVKIISTLKDKLNNLNPRNRSLRLLKIHKEWSFDLYKLNELNCSNADRIVNSLLDDRSPIQLLEVSAQVALYDDEPYDAEMIKTQKTLYKHLNSLNRKVSSLESETGIYDLFVGYPFVECQSIEGTYLRAPLLLHPCRLERTKNPLYGWALSTEEDNRPVFNETLLLALQKFNHTFIPDEFLELEKEQEEKNLVSWCIDYFKKHNIPLKIDDEQDSTTLEFPEYKLSEIPEMEKGYLYLKNFAVLGIFPQSTSNLRPDYERMMEDADAIKPILQLLGKEPVSNIAPLDLATLDETSEAEKYLLQITDESQDQVISAYRHAQNFVINGPPGTGKSHVILNIIAEALAKKQKVLVVCQKRAALDVIYNRLDAEGLAANVSLIHDHERDKKIVYGKLRQLIRKSRENNTEKSPLEKKAAFNTGAKNVDTIIKSLNNLQKAQLTPTKSGLTPHELYNHLALLDNVVEINLPTELYNKDFDAFNTEISPLLKLSAFYEKYKLPTFLSKDRHNWRNLTETNKKELQTSLLALIHLNERATSLLEYAQKNNLPALKDLQSLSDQFNKVIESLNRRHFNPDNYQNCLLIEGKSPSIIKKEVELGITILNKPTKHQLSLLEAIKKLLNCQDDIPVYPLSNLNSLTYDQLCTVAQQAETIQPLIAQTEHPQMLLTTDKRTNWHGLKGDIKEKIDTTLESIGPNIKLYQELEREIINQGIPVELIQQDKTLLIQSVQLLEDAINTPGIEKILLNWEQTDFPTANYEQILNEAEIYIANLKDVRWKIFDEMSLDEAEYLKNHLYKVSKYRGIWKYLTPPWWKSVKIVNTALERYHVEVTEENVTSLLKRIRSTIEFNRLKELFAHDLSFVPEFNSVETAFNAMKKAYKHFEPYKKYRKGELKNYLPSLKELTTDNLKLELKDKINQYNHFNSLNDQNMQLVYSLKPFFKEPFLKEIIASLSTEKAFQNVSTTIKADLEHIEAILNLDKHYYALPEQCLSIINSLRIKLSEDKEEQSVCWKSCIIKSYLSIIIQNSIKEHTMLEKYTLEELYTLNNPEISKHVTLITNTLEEIISILEALYKKIPELSSYYNTTLIETLKIDLQQPSTFIQTMETLCKELNTFDELVEMDLIKATLTPMQEIIHTRLETQLSNELFTLSTQWKNTLLKSYFLYWINKAELENENLKIVSTDQFANMVKDFETSYDTKLSETKGLIQCILKDDCSQLTLSDSIRGGKKLKDLEYQVNKQRRLWSVRKLMAEFGESHILKLLPCWLMSPEAVSAIMPLKKDLFDIVIFDEASQCAQEYALPSVIRGKNIIVGGDEKQLQPLNIFHTSVDLDTEEEEDIAIEASSLLNLAKAIFPTYLLSWHYRSKYEELINFSNHAFYDGKIQIAPNSMVQITPPPMEWHKIEEAEWLNSSNIKEAETVVNTIVQLIKENEKPPTIGVITFNIHQQNLILDLLDKKELDDPDFADKYQEIKKLDLDKRLFVKNIENVQGDERDLIIFSIGYAKNKLGKISSNFGLLNRSGGENRLNVAITRAKEKVIIFSSLEPEELQVDNTKHVGPKLLKKYLEYAKLSSLNQNTPAKMILSHLNSIPDTEITETSLKESSIAHQLKEKLEEKGFTVHTNVGCSSYKVDVAVVDPLNPDKYILGIECEGKNYHASSSARSREITRHKFLQSRGWTLTRLWSRNWWINKTYELEKIEHTINTLSQNGLNVSL